MKTTHCKRAFSLVELSIVLVILGLLTGGILGGQSLIKAAEMRSTITQLESFSVAINSFRDKYLGLPGDIRNGSQFWPTLTTDGDGNGVIEPTTTYSGGVSRGEPDNPIFDGERAAFFRQLSLAALTAQSYDGSATLGQGYPAIKMRPQAGMIATTSWQRSGAGSNIANYETYTNGSLYMAMMVCNPSTLGTSSTYNDCAIFTPEELWQLDMKVDDGKPLNGAFVAHSYNTTCVSGTDYALSVTSPTCNAMYELIP